MKIKTSELIDAPLDWAVAKAKGMQLKKFERRGPWYYAEADGVYRFIVGHTYSPSTDWAQGGPIIDRHGINIGTQRNEPGFRPHPDFMWHAQMDTRSYVGHGPTLLIAAMRCFVASRLGDEVDIPEELL